MNKINKKSILKLIIDNKFIVGIILAFIINQIAVTINKKKLAKIHLNNLISDIIKIDNEFVELSVVQPKILESKMETLDRIIRKDFDDHNIYAAFFYFSLPNFKKPLINQDLDYTYFYNNYKNFDILTVKNFDSIFIETDKYFKQINSKLNKIKTNQKNIHKIIDDLKYRQEYLPAEMRWFYTADKKNYENYFEKISTVNKLWEIRNLYMNQLIHEFNEIVKLNKLIIDKINNSDIIDSVYLNRDKKIYRESQIHKDYYLPEGVVVLPDDGLYWLEKSFEEINKRINEHKILDYSKQIADPEIDEGQKEDLIFLEKITRDNLRLKQKERLRIKNKLDSLKKIDSISRLAY